MAIPATIPTKTAVAGVVAIVLLWGVLLLACVFSERVTPNKDTTVALWLAGGAALGLVSGFTTGASNQTGIGSEFLKFISAGIITPLLGGIVTLLQFRKEMVETSRYEGGQLVQRTTADVIPEGYVPIHPLWMLGGFFLMYGIFAVVGVVIGAVLRQQKLIEIKIKPDP